MRVGDGSSIRVWHIPWLSYSENGIITTKCRSQWVDLKVVNLMLEGVRYWDVAKIESIFNVRDNMLIQSIPLSNRVVEDKWM